MNRSQVLQNIEQLLDKGELEEATHRYALIVVDLLNDAESYTRPEWGITDVHPHPMLLAI